MTQRLGLVTFLVRDYDEARDFFVRALGFSVVEDTPGEAGRRWLRVMPRGGNGPALLLARAANAEQMTAIGRQAGGRVFLFLETDDFVRDHAAMLAAGVRFLEEPRYESYGIVAVFSDLYGNKWDLLQLSSSAKAGI